MWNISLTIFLFLTSDLYMYVCENKPKQIFMVNLFFPRKNTPIRSLLIILWNKVNMLTIKQSCSDSFFFNKANNCIFFKLLRQYSINRHCFSCEVCLWFCLHSYGCWILVFATLTFDVCFTVCVAYLVLSI